MDKMKRLAGKKILLVAVALCAFGFAKAQDTQAEKNILTLTLDKKPWKLHWMRIRQLKWQQKKLH